MRSELEYSPMVLGKVYMVLKSVSVVVGPFKRRYGYGLQYKSKFLVYHPFLRFFLAINFAAK